VTNFHCVILNYWNSPTPWLALTASLRDSIFRAGFVGPPAGIVPYGEAEVSSVGCGFASAKLRYRTSAPALRPMFAEGPSWLGLHAATRPWPYCLNAHITISLN